MIGHHNIFIYRNPLKNHRYLTQTLFRNFSKGIQMHRICEVTLFPIGTNGDKIIIGFGIVIIWDAWAFSVSEFHIAVCVGGSVTLPYIYFNFFHWATASSSQRLFMGFWAWPLTQWYRTSCR